MATAVGPEVALRSRSPIARGRYIALAEQAARAAASDLEPLVVLERCTAWLELFLLSALTSEYIHRYDIRSMEQLAARAADLDEHVLASFPDVKAATKRICDIIGELPDSADVFSDGFLIDWSQVVRSFDAIIAECPIEHIEELGRRIDQPHLAYRARSSYDALRAFVRRHDPDRAEAMRIVGEQYRRGHIRLRDAARLLGMSTSDTVFELEENGFCRAATAITLTEADREVVYQRLRTRRLHREDPPTVDDELVERDVVASERIEGVDARAWIRRR